MKTQERMDAPAIKLPPRGTKRHAVNTMKSLKKEATFKLPPAQHQATHDHASCPMPRPKVLPAGDQDMKLLPGFEPCTGDLGQGRRDTKRSSSQLEDYKESHSTAQALDKSLIIPRSGHWRISNRVFMQGPRKRQLLLDLQDSTCLTTRTRTADQMVNQNTAE